MMKCYLGIGSNLGNREKNITAAIELLAGDEQIIRLSSLIETKPMYYLRQQPFLNGVIHLNTYKTPRQLLEHLQEIEHKMGRKRIFKNGPRIIDLDILFYGAEIISEPDLVIPHPFLQEREFVLRPLTEINPEFIHPVLNQTVKKLLEQLGGLQH